MRVLMLVWSDVSTDARVVREAQTIAAAGHDVHVIGRAVAPDYEPPPGVTVSSVGRPPGSSNARRSRVPAPMLRAARWLALPTYVRRRLAGWTAAAERDAGARDFDVVHAHDFNTLELGARLAGGRGVPLVYDAHEYWRGRPRLARPTPLTHWRDDRREARLAGAAAVVLTVSPAVAELLRGAYRWSHVRVVRNTFPMPPDLPAAPPGPPRGAVYAGRLAPFRELETVIAAADQLPELEVTLIGPWDEEYVARLHPGRCNIRPPIDLDDVTELVRAAGLALVTHSDRWPNHRAALPNKLFLAVRAGVPVIATDVPQLRAVVQAHGFGVLYRPGDVDSFVAAVRSALDRYPELAAASVAARAELSWERDARELLDAYAALPIGRPGYDGSP